MPQLILPDVPCATELGFETLNANYWIGFSGSSELPEEVCDKIAEACEKIITDEDFQADIGKIGAVVDYASGEDMLNDIKDEIDVSARLIALGND